MSSKLDRKIMEQLHTELSQSSKNILERIFSAIICASKDAHDKPADDDSKEQSVFELLGKLTILIQLNDLTGFYYIFYDFLGRIMQIYRTQVKSVKKVYQLNFSIEERVFRQFLQVNTDKYRRNPSVQVQDIFDEISYKPNENTDDGIREMNNYLYSYCLAKFRQLAEDNISIPSALIDLENLYNSLRDDICETALHLQSIVMEDGLTIGGVTLYRGEGYQILSNCFNALINKKEALWSSHSKSSTTFDSIEDYYKFMEENDTDFQVTSTWGLEPLDKYTPIYRSDLISFIAMESTGKTTIMSGYAAMEILNGFSPIFMVGESSQVKIFNMVLARIIYEKTKEIGSPIEINWIDIADTVRYDKLSDLKKAIITEIRHDFLTNPNYGKLILVDKFSYNCFTQEILDKMAEHPEYVYGHIFIDHAGSLKLDNNLPGGNFYKDKYIAMADLLQLAIDIKKQTGSGIWFAVHPNNEAIKAAEGDKKIGMRSSAGSSGFSKDVDLALFLKKNDSLKKQGLLEYIPLKVRSIRDDDLDPFIVKKEFNSCRVIYSPELQAALSDNKDNELKVADMDPETLIG